MIQCNVAVSGLNAADDPAPGIAVIRSLRDSAQWKGKIIGLAYDALDTGVYDPGLLDEVYLLPYPLDRGGLLQRFKEITRKTRIDVLMPLLDLELLSLSQIEPLLKDMGIHLLLPPLPMLRMHFKIKLGEFCNSNGIKYPRQALIVAPDKIPANVKLLGLPIVVKGIVHESHLAYSADEALIYFNKIKTRWGLPIILQEYITGDEYNTDCLTDKQGRLIGAVSMRKLAVTDKGKGWSGVTIKNDELLKLSQELLTKLHWTGPIEFEFLKQRSSHDYYLLEINPRFGAWIYLATSAGQNLPLAAVQIAMGEQVKPFDSYKAGMMFIRHSMDVICSIERMASIAADGQIIFSSEKTKELTHYEP